MAKLLLHLFLFITICKPVAGQMRLGVHGGMNTSSIDPQIAESEFNTIGSQYSYSSPKIGYYAGIFTEFKLSNYINLMLECDYSQKKYEEISTLVRRISDPFKKTSTTQLNFAEIGSLVIYGLPLGAGKLSIGAGGKVAYIFSGKTEVFEITPVGPSHYVEKVSKKLVPGVSGILKYEFNPGLSFELKYDYLIKAQPNIDLSVFGIGAGYILRFKTKGK